jgi:protein TonB
MKRKNNLLSLMLCVSLALHGVLFFLLPVYPVNNPWRPAPVHSPDPFALVNVALIEPAAPITPPPPVLPGESFEEPADIDPAETLIPVAELIPVTPGFPPPTETSAANSTGETPSDEKADAAGNAALTKTYVKYNYNTIMRSIQRNLTYPDQAKRAGFHGTAEISFTIHEDGRISNVLVVSSSGSGLLDTAAVDAIKAISPFQPPPPAEARLVIPVTFKLR